MKDKGIKLVRKLLCVLMVVSMAIVVAPGTAFAASSTQVVKSSWTEVVNIYEDYSYYWKLRMTLTIEDGMLVDAVCAAQANEGGDVPPMEKPYYESQHLIMEDNILDKEIAANNPSAVDDVDIVSGATHTSTAMKKATKEALEKWNANVLSAQGAIDAINAIASSDDKDAAVSAARRAYNALSSDLKTYIPDDVYAILVDAENVQHVVSVIKAISGSSDMKAAVIAAREAYDSLGSDLREQIPTSVVQILTSAEVELIAEANLANATVTVSPVKYTFANKAFTPAVTVTSKNGVKLAKGTDYTVVYVNNKNAGKATVTVSGIGGYTGKKSAAFTIAKAPQAIKPAKTYSVKLAKVKKAKQSLAVKFTATGGGKVTYAAAKSGKVSIAKNGKVTVAKGAAKKTYTLKVKCTAAEKGNYAKTTKTVELKVKVA